MDEGLIKKMQQGTQEMVGQAEKMSSQAGDFPALKANLKRIQASLAMMSIDLGLAVVPEE